MQVSNVQSETQRRTWVGTVSRWIVVLGLLALMPELMGLGGCPCGDDADCPDGDFCDEGACVDCRDNADCSTELPVCVDTFCEECGQAADCDDGNACTTDTCDEINECVRDAVTCDDDDACTTDSCDPAVGCENDTVVCKAGFECDPDTGECVAKPCTSDAECDDGDLCTTDDCTDGVCDLVATVCSPGLSCNPATGECGDATPMQVDVLQLGGFSYPTGLFRCGAPEDPQDPSESCPDGSGCDEHHWHSDTVAAIASVTGDTNVSGNTIDDPDTCMCGHGKVSEVTRTMISLDGFELANYLSLTNLDELPAAGACPP